MPGIAAACSVIEGGKYKTQFGKMDFHGEDFIVVLRRMWK